VPLCAKATVPANCTVAHRLSEGLAIVAPSPAPLANVPHLPTSALRAETGDVGRVSSDNNIRLDRWSGWTSRCVSTLTAPAPIHLAQPLRIGPA